MSEESSRRLRLLWGLVLWLLVTAACTWVLWVFREDLDLAHKTLAYLLIVLGSSAREGRVVGLIVAITSFLAFNFFLVPPLYSMTIEDPLEWWILLSFLITGTVAAELLHRAQRAARLAEERAVEIARLAREAEHVEALREADRLKDALLASVSHDLRTPLTSIRAMAAEMRDTDERAVIIEEEAERLNRFVTDLLDYSRIRGGALPMEPELNAADDLIGATLERLRGLPEADRIQVTLPADGSILVGRFDFVHALRALVNLVENALRHAPQAEPVVIELSATEDFLVFAVTDRGPGVGAEDRDHLFEPFFKASDREGGGGSGGTGLGLAIARSVAEAQGGTVEYRPREGGGSVFELRLPRADLPKLP